MGNIIGLFGAASARRQTRQDWSNQDLAELYRVESALVQAGMRVETERGMTDEGDPWFAFCHGDSGEVIAHFARIDGEYVVGASVFSAALRGPDLRAIVQRFVSENPVSLPSPDTSRRGNVVLHPAALMTMFVATIILMETPTRSHAAEAPGPDAGANPHALANGEAADAPAIVPDFALARLDDDEHPRFGDKTLLLTAVVAVAVEAARYVGESEAAAGTPGLAHGLGDGLSLADSADDDIIAVDLAPTRDIFAGDAARAADGRGAELPVPEAESGDIQLLADRAQHAEFDPAAVLIPESTLREAAANAEPAASDHTTPAAVIREISADSAGLRVDEPETSGAGQAESEASTALEDKIAAEGWSADTLDRDNGIVARLVAAMDGNETGPADDELPKLIVGDSADDDASPADPHALSAYDDAARQFVAVFKASVGDLGDAESGNGSHVYFDESDLAEGDLLVMLSWDIGNDHTISILGQADTLAHALALVA